MNRRFRFPFSAAAAFCAAIASAVLPAGAADVSEKDAGVAARAWVARGRAPGSAAAERAVAGADLLTDPATGARIRIVRFEGGGYVVMPTDDRIEPVLAFSGSGAGVDTDPANPFWALLRADVAAREAAAGISRNRRGPAARRASPAASAAADGQEDERTAEARRKWADLLGGTASGGTLRRSPNDTAGGPADVRVEPFVATRWSQASARRKKVWNLLTPKNYDCGCIATATGQLMYRWRHPAGSVKPKTRMCSLDHEPAFQTMYEGTYDWDDMPVNPFAETPSDKACKAVGRLVYDIGVAVCTDWAKDGSSASVHAAGRALREDFGYAGAVLLSYDAGVHDWSLAEFERTVAASLDARSPVEIGIADSEDHGHAVLADGYGYSDGGFFVHLNFGWGGLSDAWYRPPDIDEFDVIDSVICNVFPDKSGTILSGRVLDAGGGPVAGATVALLSGDVEIDSTGTDERGVYAFVADGPASFVVRADAGALSARMPVSIGKTVSVDVVKPDGTYLPGCSIGNSPGNDILLSDGPAPSFAVVLDRQDGAGGAETVTATFGEPLPAVSIPSREGWTFGGYWTAPGGEGIQYYAPSGSGLRPWNRFGDTTLYAAWTEAADTKSRDAFKNARPVSGETGSASFCNVGYTKEKGEPKHSGEGRAGGASAWAAWTAPSDGWFTFFLFGRGGNPDGRIVEPQLAVYTGSAVSKLQLVASNDDADGLVRDSRVSFEARRGTVYRIAMDTCDGRTHAGNLLLAWQPGFFRSLEPERDTVFANASGGPRRLGMTASGGWTATRWPDWIEPEKATGGTNEAFLFSVAENATGEVRSGSVRFEAGAARPVSVEIVQGTLDWREDGPSALAQALAEGKRVFLLSGRDTCPNTRMTRFSSAESAPVRPLLEAGYVLWYNDCDARYGEVAAFIGDLGDYEPPVACIVDPARPRAWIDRTQGWQSASELAARLGPVALLDAAGGSLPSPVAYPPLGGTCADLPVPERPGHSFAGWIPADATAALDPDAALPAGVASFVALWRPRVFGVALDDAGGTGGSRATQATFGAPLPDVDVPVRDHFKFGGYWSGPDGTGTRYWDENGRGVRDWDVDGNVTLHAAWTGDPFAVSFDFAGGSSGTERIVAEYGAPLPDVVPPVRPGFAFLGYFLKTEAGGTVQYCDERGRGVRPWDQAADTVLSAAWSEFSVFVVYDANGNAPRSAVVRNAPADGPTGNLPTVAPAIDGWRFLGWTAGGGLLGSLLELPGGTERVILSAVWAPVHRIAFDPAGGSGSMPPLDGIGRGEARTLPGCTFVRRGCAFVGWATRPGGPVRYFDGETVADLSLAPGATVTLHAVWADTATTVFADPAGGHVVGAAAYRTLQAAVDAAPPRGTILAYPGVYDPIDFAAKTGFALDGSLLDRNREYVVRAIRGPSETVIDGGGTRRCANLEDDGVKLVGFTLRNGYADRGGGAKGGTLFDCIVEDCKAELHGGGVDDGRLLRCTVRRCLAGFLGGGLHDSAAENCLLESNATGSQGGGAACTTLGFCTVVGNVAGTAAGGAAGCDILDSIVWDNRLGDGTLSNIGPCVSGNGLVEKARVSNTDSKPKPAGTGNVSAVPKFADADAGDFRLAAGSPCIGKAKAADATPDYLTGTLAAGVDDLDETGLLDRDGLPRKIGAPDMGAFERLEGTPVPADYDGDGVCDAATFDAASATWVVRQSRDGLRVALFGDAKATPVPADYDGDGAADFATYSATDRTPAFRIRTRLGAESAPIAIGAKGAVPFAADFDGDGLADPAVFQANAKKPSFVALRSSANWNAAPPDAVSRTFGTKGAVPFAGDFDGDGLADFGFYSASASKPAFKALLSGADRSTAKAMEIVLGAKGSVPCCGDFDGDGTTDFAAYAGSAKTPILYRMFSTSRWRETRSLPFGAKGSRAATGDWDGDGLADPAIETGGGWWRVSRDWDVERIPAP